MASRVDKVEKRLDRIEWVVESISKTVNKIEKRLEEDYIVRIEFNVLKDRMAKLEKIIYGVIAVILTAVAYAVLNLIGLSQ